jgi:hypothetical protein
MTILISREQEHIRIICISHTMCCQHVQVSYKLGQAPNATKKM